MSFLTFYDPFQVRMTPSYQRELARRQQQAYNAWQALAQNHATLLGAFDDLFSNLEPSVRTPSVDLKEEGTDYVIEAELPGVKREDLEVTIGEGGKTITIEGKVVRREASAAPETSPTPAQPTEPAATEAPATESPATEVAAPQTSEVAQQPQLGEVAADAGAERTYSAVFSRTFTLPRPVDGARVSAKLVDGVLTLRVPHLEDPKSVRVTVD